MLRIVIEDDRAQTQQPQQATMTGAASGGAVAPHIRQTVERRVAQQPTVFAPAAQGANAQRATNAGAPPGWLHEAVKGLVSKAAESSIKRSGS